MEDYDIYVGLRSSVEIEKCLQDHVFDLVIGVYDYRKPHEDVKSNDADVLKYSDYIILNNGTLEDLYLEVLNCLKRLNITGLIRKQIFEEIDKERNNQVIKWGDQKHSTTRWVSILTEEVGEVAKEANDATARYDMHRDLTGATRRSQIEMLNRYRMEMIQVTAVAIAAIEDFDKNMDLSEDPTEEYWSQKGCPFDEKVN